MCFAGGISLLAANVTRYYKVLNTSGRKSGLKLNYDNTKLLYVTEAGSKSEHRLDLKSQENPTDFK